jgi:Domain of unknown function (DUF4399)
VRLPRSLGLLLVVVAACGGGDGSDGGDPASAAGVSIAFPENEATVESTFPVTMEAAGFTVEPAGDVTEGAGHFHLIVDAACISPGEQIPADDAHVHLADGAGEIELTLPAGEHTLCLQAGDGRHAALDLTDEITITVAGGGDETTTQAEEGEAIEDWEGTYEGGRADMEALHTVTGSCADTGSLSTALYIEGKRTASGFRFPATGWGLPGSFTLRVNGDTAEGRVSGAIPGPATMRIVFDLDCTYGC